MSGFIYILKQSNGRSVKIGQTTVSSINRLRQYTKEYELKNFTNHKEYAVPAKALNDVENLAHKYLSKFQISGLGGAREIFACSPKEAEEAIEKAIVRSEQYRKEKDAERIRVELEEKKAKELDDKWQNSEEKIKLENFEAELRALIRRNRELNEEIKSVEENRKDDSGIVIVYWIIILILFISPMLASVPFAPLIIVAAVVSVILFYLAHKPKVSDKDEKKELEKNMKTIEIIRDEKKFIKENFYKYNSK